MFAKAAKEILTGGLGDNKPTKDFPKSEVKSGLKVESEHTPVKKLQLEIVKDHLTENVRYYKKLKKLKL